MLKVNVGGIDRILRVVVGLALVTATALGFLNVWGWLGMIPLLTGLFRFCPVYTILGIKTCKVN